MKQNILRTWTSGVLMAAILFGCKASPAPNVGFADPKLLKNDPTIPFNKFWRKPGVNWRNYDKIYVADVNTSYMLKTTDWQKGERKADIERDVKTLSIYARGSFMKAFREDPNHRFEVVDNPTHDPHALVFEVALIEVVPSKVLLNALGYAPFFIGTGITVIRSITNDKSTAAFESRTRDAATGEIIMLAADREAEQFAVVDVRGLSWYSDAEGIIDEWSKEFVLIANKKPNEKIEGTSTFRLLPW
ncbi:MAG: DUF3313 domain-containing protein [Planctomycetota bacterium]|nr:DUF3313 domain-containing protein [Planctomycetota bacterium]